MWGLGGEKWVHELLHSACLRALALQLPSLCPWRWEEANEGGGSGKSPGALGGMRGTQELLASHLSGQCPVLELGNGGPRRQGEGTRIGGGVSVLLKLSSKKWLDFEVVGSVPAWGSKVVESRQRSTKNVLELARMDCATTGQGNLFGLATWLFVRVPKETASGLGHEGGGWHCP